MIFRLPTIAFFITAVIAVNAAAQSIAITPESTYHGATFSERFKEKWPEDTGGLLYLFVRNTGGQMETIQHVELNGRDSSTYATVRWWRAWPAQLAPGVCGWVAIKAVGEPLGQGQKVEVELKTASGVSAKTSVECVTPALRLANVLPSPDSTQLYIYLRNDGSDAIHLNKLFVNDLEYAIGQDPAVQLVGSADLAAGGLAILKLGGSLPWQPLAPLAVRVSGEHNTQPVYCGAGLRLTEPGFSIGTWSSGLPKDILGVAYARNLGIDCAVTGKDWDANAAMHKDYYIRTLASVNTGEPKAPDLAAVDAQQANKDIAAWMVRDEPDLNGKTSNLMAEHNLSYWQHDADTPTYMNLMTNAGFNEYANIPDIACMDHYVMYAPNVLPWSGVTRTPAMEEAIDYTRYLKQNSEPVRMWSWCQLAADVWGRQPLAWGISYQFWAHVMEGAKGILWFKYGPGFENKFTGQINAAEHVMRQFEPVRTLCFYGEPLKNITSESDKALGRTLNSENATVAVVLNNNYEVGGIPMHPRYTLTPLKAKVFIPVPAWVPVEQVTALTPEGPKPIEYELNGGVVSLQFATGEEMGVFLIGKKDTTPPGPIQGLHSTSHAEGLFILSWQASPDNYGVQGYTVYQAGKPYANVTEPVAILRGPQAKTGLYSVDAYDAAGNRTPICEPIHIP